jgi:hypothetical protein
MYRRRVSYRRVSMGWIYDIYRHVKRPELRLVVRSGSGLPSQAPKESWRLEGQERSIPAIEAAEVLRSGFSVSKTRRRPKDSSNVK